MKSKFFHRPLMPALATATLGFSAVTLPISVHSAAMNQDTGAMNLDISAGPLVEALKQFALQTGLALSYDPTLFTAKTTNGLKGAYTAQEGLQELLTGTGVTFNFKDARTVILNTAEINNAGQVLEPLKIEGVAEVTRIGDMPPEQGGFKADYQRSATKMPTAIRDTPQSISVVTRDSLDDRQVMTQGQALELSAGVTQFSGNGPFAGQPSFGFNQTTIRGIQIDDIYDFREDGFVNGSYFSIPDLAIYDRIEVVKGPSSMLYGRGSAGGLINRVRKQPEKEAHTELGMDIGSFDTYRVDVDTTGPLLSSDSVQGRLVAAYQDDHSFVHGPQSQRTVLAPSLSIDLGPRTRLLLQGLYQSEDIIANTGFPLRPTADGFEAPDIDRSQYNGVISRDPYTWTTESATVELEHELDDHWLATLRLNNANIDTPNHVDAYVYSYGGVGPSGDVGVYGSDFQIDRDIWSGELQVSGKPELWGREAAVAFGVDWSQNQYSRRGAYTSGYAGNIYTGVFTAPNPDSFTPGFANESQPISRGAFVQTQVWPAERLSVLLGLRYDNVTLSNIPFHSQLDPVPPREVDTVDKLTGRVGLTYELRDEVSVYTLYSQSFTPEEFSTDINGNLLKPQTGELYEAGVKSEWLAGRLGATAAIYRLDRENIATSVPDDPGDDIPPYSIASGLQRSDGFEIEVNGRPMPGWDVSFAYNHVNSAYKDPNDPLFGSQPGGTPKWQLGMFSSYELQTGMFKGFGYGATFFAIDDRGIGFNPGTIPGYERIDLHFFYKGFEKTEISLVIRNVTDEVYIEGADRPGGLAQFGSPTAALLSIRREL